MGYVCVCIHICILLSVNDPEIFCSIAEEMVFPGSYRKHGLIKKMKSPSAVLMIAYSFNHWHRSPAETLSFPHT